MDAYYALIIVGTLIGFCGLAYLLLAPIWRFLDREKEASDKWTKEVLARRRRRQSNGKTGDRPSASETDSDDPSPPPRDHPSSDASADEKGPSPET